MRGRANQGQLKNLATNAFEEFADHLHDVPGSIGDTDSPDGTGSRLLQLYYGFASPTEKTDDFAPVNLGQLKNVAKPFYDRLIEYTDKYPWIESTNPADDYAIANLGQLKSVFSFNLTGIDGINGGTGMGGGGTGTGGGGTGTGGGGTGTGGGGTGTGGGGKGGGGGGGGTGGGGPDESKRCIFTSSCSRDLSFSPDGRRLERCP